MTQTTNLPRLPNQLIQKHILSRVPVNNNNYNKMMSIKSCTNIVNGPNGFQVEYILLDDIFRGYTQIYRGPIQNILITKIVKGRRTSNKQLACLFAQMFHMISDKYNLKSPHFYDIDLWLRERGHIQIFKDISSNRINFNKKYKSNGVNFNMYKINTREHSNYRRVKTNLGNAQNSLMNTPHKKPLEEIMEELHKECLPVSKTINKGPLVYANQYRQAKK